MKINLGAGNLIQEGYLNHDLVPHRKEIDYVFDLNKFPYPLLDNSCEEVKMWDVLEHLDDVIAVMNELWRVIKPDGKLDLKLCGWKNESYWIDVTHKRAFHQKSMDYFDPDTEIGKEYSYYTTKKWKSLS